MKEVHLQEHGRDSQDRRVSSTREGQTSRPEPEWTPGPAVGEDPGGSRKRSRDHSLPTPWGGKNDPDLDRERCLLHQKGAMPEDSG